MRRTDAFKKISEDSGRREGTVAANYYRVARQRGVELLPRGGRTPRTDTVDVALRRAVEAVEALANVARAQEQELNTLRSQSEQLEKLRRMLV